MIEKEIFVWCTFEFEGFHRWYGAPEIVSYLRTRHRHMFKVRVDVEVKGDDREIEFITLKKYCSGMLDRLNPENVGSCEQIATVFLTGVIELYPNRKIIVEVSEDGENGATVRLN